MTASMLNGGTESVGTMTSGGTESVLMSVKTARDRARAKNKRITKPNLVVPETIHVAFDKAASYFGLKDAAAITICFAFCINCFELASTF